MIVQNLITFFIMIFLVRSIVIHHIILLNINLLVQLNHSKLLIILTKLITYDIYVYISMLNI